MDHPVQPRCSSSPLAIVSVPHRTSNVPQPQQTPQGAGGCLPPAFLMGH